MPAKNTVAVERRTDLASLFCMIGRHGPAVALAVIAMVSVVAGFIFYRNVRGKRKKATVGDAAASGAERDASTAGTDEEPELSESTDTGDEGSSHTTADPDLIQSGPRLRHGRSPSAKKPPTETSAVEDGSRVAETHKDLHILQGDSTSVTAASVKDEDDDCHGLLEDAATNVEPDCNIECSLEPVSKETPTNDVKAFQETCGEDRNTIIEGVSQGKACQENLERASDGPLCSELQSPMSETINDLKLQEDSDTSSHLGTQTVKTRGDLSDLRTSEVEESPSCVHGQDHARETQDDKLQGSGASPDTNGQSDEPINNIGGGENAEVENVCDSKDPLCFSEDSQTSETDKVQVSEVTPNAVCLEGQIIDIKEVSNGSVQEENPQSASRSPVRAFQNVNIGENGDDIRPQIGDMTSGPDGNLEEPVNIDPVPEISQNVEGQLEEKCHEEESDLIKHEVEVIPEYSGDQVFAQQLGDLPSQQDLKLLCSQQDWCHATNNVQLSSQEDDHFQTAEVTEDFRGEDSLYNLAEVTLDVNAPELHEHQLQDEHKNNGFSPTQDGGKGKVVGPCGDDREETSDVASLTKGDEGKDVNVEASDVHLPNLMSDAQPQSERRDEVAPVLEQTVADEIASERNESGEVVLLAGESEHVEASCYEDPQSDGSKSQDMLDTNGNPSTDAPIGDEPIFSSSVLPHPVPSDQLPNAAFPELGSSATSEMTGFSNGQISLSLSESQLTQSISGFGGESGISSMAVSPDLSEALDEFGTTPDHLLPSPMDCHPYSEEWPESQVIFTRDEAEAFNAGRVGAEPLRNPLQQSSQDGAMDSCYAVNEDMFGDDIEDGYHSRMGQLIAAKTMNLTDEVTKVLDNVPVPVVQVDGKEGTKKSKEGEEECEKTEINIMEATMDNNEWITDGNYQALPWMNLSAGPFPPNSSKSEPSPDAPPFSLPDDTSLETDIPPSSEASQTDTLSLEESLDGSKKILAVQPMPQNVSVTFCIHYVTQSPYQKLAVTGNHDELGNWKEFILLEKAKDGHWSTVVSLPAESHVEWKFVVLEKGAVCRWEECGNRFLETGGGEDLLVHKWWGIL